MLINWCKKKQWLTSWSLPAERLVQELAKCIKAKNLKENKLGNYN